MAGTATEPTTRRVLVFNLHDNSADELTRALRRHRFAVSHSQLGSGRQPAARDIAAAVVSAPALDAKVSAAAKRLRATYPRTPLLLWAPLEPADVARALDSGFTLWLPADAPATAVALQISTLSRLLAAPVKTSTLDSVAVRNVTVDFQRCEVTINDSQVPLSPSEFRIISHLARRPGRVVSHGELFREVHGYDTTKQETKDMLKVYIWRLRNKLTAAGADDDLIVNVRGFGYLLERRATRSARNAAGA